MLIICFPLVPAQQYQNRALITINNQVPIIKQDSISQELLEYLKVGN